MTVCRAAGAERPGETRKNNLGTSPVYMLFSNVSPVYDSYPPTLPGPDHHGDLVRVRKGRVMSPWYFQDD